MGESDRYQDYRNQPRRTRLGFTFGDDKNALMGLFALNVIFFLVLMLIQVAYYFYDQKEATFYAEVVRWFALPGNLTTFSERPWSILTFMFSETSVMGLLSHMIWLWAFGFLLQEMTGNSKLIPIYIYGGLLGGIVFIISSLAMPASAQAGGYSLIGAGAATMAVATATTTLSPNYKFFTQIRGGISIWVLLGIYILIDLASLAGTGAPFALAHLGGALAGFLFVVVLRRGLDLSNWMNNFYNWFMNMFNPNKKGHSTHLKDKVFYNTGDRKPYTKTSNITQQRVDEILDKINQKGFHFLTDEEKKILKKAAEDDAI